MDKKTNAIIAQTIVIIALLSIIGYLLKNSISDTTSQATPTPPPSLYDPNATILPVFKADFDQRLIQWQPIQGKWSIVQDGQSRYQSSSDATRNIAIAGDSKWSNYSVSGTIKATRAQANVTMGILVRYQDSDHYYFAGYSQQCTSATPTTTTENKTSCTNYWSIWHINGTTSDVLAKTPTEPITTGTDYNLRVAIDGRNLQLYVNDTLQASSEDKTDTPYNSGKMGLYVFNATASYDNISVQAAQVAPIVTPTPLITSSTIAPAGAVTTTTGIIDSTNGNGMSITFVQIFIDVLLIIFLIIFLIFLLIMRKKSIAMQHKIDDQATRLKTLEEKPAPAPIIQHVPTGFGPPAISDKDFKFPDNY